MQVVAAAAAAAAAASVSDEKATKQFKRTENYYELMRRRCESQLRVKTMT